MQQATGGSGGAPPSSGGEDQEVKIELPSQQENQHQVEGVVKLLVISWP